MPVIRISEETMNRLKKWAKPLEDTAESAFVKVLDAAEGERVPPEKTVADQQPRRRPDPRTEYDPETDPESDPTTCQ